MKKTISALLAIALCAAVLAGCGAQSGAAPLPTAAPTAAGSEPTATPETPAAETALPDGAYQADFDTDSSMFGVNEACAGKGKLTVANGVMTIHVSLMSQKIVNLYPGLAADAQKAGAVLLQPSLDTVTYSDGTAEQVYGFDIPVPALGSEFDVALLGAKGTWYDHKVSVSNPTPVETAAPALEDGAYTCEVALQGGSGRAAVESPAAITVQNGQATATIVWSSPNYDYMKVGEQKYLPLQTEGNATFEIPVSAFDAPMDVVADTVAMSTPHEVEYSLTFALSSLQKAPK